MGQALGRHVEAGETNAFASLKFLCFVQWTKAVWNAVWNALRLCNALRLSVWVSLYNGSGGTSGTSI